jgi:hypothetical protein
MSLATIESLLALLMTPGIVTAARPAAAAPMPGAGPGDWVERGRWPRHVLGSLVICAGWFRFHRYV